MDEAWGIAKKGGDNVVKAVQKDGRTSYIIDMGRRIGYEGGGNGSNTALSKIQIIIEKGTESDVVTGYPVK